MRRSSLPLAALAVAALAACDTPVEPPSDMDLPAAAAELISPEYVADVQQKVDFYLESYMTHTGPGVTTYDFNDLSGSCSWNEQALPASYQDLTVLGSPVYMAVCSSPPFADPADRALIPSNSSGGLFDRTAIYEVRIALAHQATSVGISSWIYIDNGAVPTLTAYDSDGASLGSVTFSTANDWETQSIAASGIVEIGLSSGQGMNYWDNLTVEYLNDPETKDDCKNGGWAQYGFKNQGQCVRFVETGKDSRD